jgi:hypothetical protein
VNPLKSVFEQLRGAASTVIGEIQSLDQRIEALHAEREALVTDPLSKADYLAYMVAEMNTEAAKFSDQLRASAQGDKRNFIRLDKDRDSGFGMNTGYLGLIRGQMPGTAVMNPAAFCFFFGEMAAEKIGTALDAMPWPKDAVPVADRRRRMAEIEAEIARLDSERDSLAQNLQEIGIKG